ncbi:olfactory receptor 10A2-like [Pyxicephalus adspersus]|uniref:olfactory receptor 10A2-like n=1 Tax=Pyxicephalus adspersus TaxID=30357 RepID=UPI003B5C3DE2
MRSSPFESTCSSIDSTRGQFTVIYLALVDWESELGTTWELEEWWDMIYSLSKISRNSAVVEANYKVALRCKTLHSPMYFFLSQLSISDILLITDIVPNMLNIILHERTPISFPTCITQYYVFGSIEGFECFLLTVMSYDRYVAICSPLHYVSIMNHGLCIKLVLSSWLLGCSLAFIVALGLCQLEFCGPNGINYFYCDLNPLVELSFSDTSTVQVEGIFMCFPVLIIPFLVIVVSYTCIVLTLLKIPSYSGRLKSFSTCSSHLTVVFLFYGTLIAAYLIPTEGQSRTISKMMSILYTVLTPFLNPFIYSLRNKDIKNIVRNVFLEDMTLREN